ncbi:hypothetical protein RB595_004956 [Gaeumannomyces hyphopodioides]
MKPTHQDRLAYIAERIEAGAIEAKEYTKRVESESVTGDLLWPVGGSFTLAEPHSCTRCQDATLTQQTLEGQDWDTYTLKLEASLATAVDACLSGCALYRYFVDSLTSYKLDLPGTLEAGTHVLKFELFAGADGPRGSPSTPPPPSTTHPSGSVPPPGSDTSTTPHLKQRISLVMEDGSAQKMSSSSFQYLEMFAREGDPAARFISTRPFELDKRSQRTVQTARNCLERCIKCHPGCRVGGSLYGNASSFLAETERLAPSDIPSRLLQVKGGSGREIRLLLVETGGAPRDLIETISQEGYIVLSYCWGADQPIKLTKETHASLTTQGVDTDDLPRTLRDAAWFVREMGRQFLWVDALCILQDSVDDKAVEISRMGTYYGSSAATLSAASAWNCNQGFLEEAGPQGQSLFLTGPIRVRFKSLDNAGAGGGYAYLFNRIQPPPEPITTRAWTLQEAFLSRRLLIFAASQMYWCCSSGYSDESGALRERTFGGPDSPVALIYPTAKLVELPAELGWRRVVTSYTRRGLGFAGDKLPAVAALAQAFVRIAADRGRRWKYLAGLQIDVGEEGGGGGDDLDEVRRKKMWAAALMWHSASWQDCTRPADYRAPSWSWAAVEGRVNLKEEVWKGPVSGDVAIRVDDYGVVPKDPRAPFGMVASGFVLLQAKLIAPQAALDLGVGASIQGDDWEPPSPLKAKFQEEPTLELRPDSMTDLEAFRAGICGYTDPLPLSLLVVNGGVGFKEAHNGLVVCPASPDLRDGIPKKHASVTNVCRRIGTFILRPLAKSVQGQGQGEDPVKTLLNGIEPQLVCLL